MWRKIIPIFATLVCHFPVSYGLHLTGSWNSNDFYLFLTKFGFQKTDPKELEDTQGFIYGNITLIEPPNSSKEITLVVVDSEYFLEFYGNRTLSPKNACPAMFRKIDRIAFDYICKPKGLEDFLRKLPCPKGKLCVDEDNPKNVVPGYQFTYKVRDVQRPRFWYLSIVSCHRDINKCEWISDDTPSIRIHYDIWLVNGDPSVKHLNPFEHQFSFEFHDVFEIHLIAFLFCFFIFLLWLYAFHKQKYILTKIFTVCLCGEMLSIGMNLIHVTIFAFNGVGADWLGKLGTLMDLAVQCCFMLLLLLIAKGLGITTVEFRWRSIMFGLWTAYTLLNLFLYIWNLVEIDDIISNTDEWQTWPGYATLAFRIIMMIWFFYELRRTYGHRAGDDTQFVQHFGAFFLVWFIYLPAVALITTQVSLLWRYKTILSINYSVDILAFAVIVHLFWPDRSILTLLERERPIPMYDLEITGLLDDIQETTLFNRATLETSRIDASSSSSNGMTEDAKNAKRMKTTSPERQNGTAIHENGDIQATTFTNIAFKDDEL